MAKKIWIVLGFFLFWILCLTTAGEAVVAIVARGGPIQVFFDKEQIWKPLEDIRSLSAGDQILTGKEAFIELLLEDGSQLYLDEETQLAFNEIEYSLAPKKRNIRLTLFWGNLRATAASGDFHYDLFEIQTDTVIVGLKSSHLQIIAEEATSPQMTSDVTLRPIEGKFEIRQIEAGNTQVECRLDDKLTGITFVHNAVNIPLDIDIRPTESKIILKSQVPVRNLRAFLTQHSNTLRVENMNHEDSLITFLGENMIIIGQQAVAFLKSSPDKLSQMLAFEMKKHVNIIFKFQSDADVKGMEILCEKGRVEVNGNRLAVGTSVLLLPDDEQETTEVPVEPLAPDSRAPFGGEGMAPTPTPIPTYPEAPPTPTSTATPVPEPPAPPRIPTASPVLP